MMHMLKRIALLCFFAFTACSIGCQGKTNSRYTPASATARQSIDTALSKWKSGAKYGMISDTTPTVIIEEPRWKTGMKLENFEIVEEVMGTEYPQFKVKLKLAGKPEVIADYLVVGINPPIVYSKEEYDITSGKTSGM